MNTKQQKRMLKDEGENKSVGFGNFYFFFREGEAVSKIWR